ncbi:MAG: BON domain-containing protein [Halomonadaceae bacterium]|nr:MAG: BON domain-containing protein [Halomonadaceae bacterium]
MRIQLSCSILKKKTLAVEGIFSTGRVSKLKRRLSMSELSKQIRARLEHDPAVNLHASDLVITDAEVVHLKGVVPDIRAKRKAWRIASELAQGKGVNDELRLQSDLKEGDDRLAEALDLALRKDSIFHTLLIRNLNAGDEPLERDSNGIELSAADGVLAMAGQVPSLSHRRLAEVNAWWTPGVVDVDNRLQLQWPEEENDDEISDTLLLVMEKDWFLHGHEIRVQVRNKEVTLLGRVASSALSQRAEWDCWYVPGVREVHNSLTVS